MKVSLNHLAEWVDLSKIQLGSLAETVSKILTDRGLEVEEVLQQGAGLEKVVSAKILEKSKHPEADRLSLCKVQFSETGEPIDIVCGAQNMKAGDIVALAQIGANLPNGMKISQGKIRGVVSNGMLCSESELGLKSESDGILILPENTPIGVSLSKVLGLTDTLLTLKLTANRADCLSLQGIAREISSALKAPLLKNSQKWLNKVPYSQNLKRKIIIQSSASLDVPQFYGVEISGVQVKESPQWLQNYLKAIGARPINNIVDATNFVMFELGHPVHAYDADLLRGNSIGVDYSMQGSKLKLLDESEVHLTGAELVIVEGYPDNQFGPIGLAGVMGGCSTAVNEKTQNLFLECAQFSPISIRKTASRYSKKTDASHRFERGIDCLQLEAVMGYLVETILSVAGGEVTGSGFIKNLESPIFKESFQQKDIQWSVQKFVQFVGMAATSDEIKSVLESLHCKVIPVENGTWKIKVPSFRIDLRGEEDLAEEVARCLGYDRIPSTIPVLSTPPESRFENAAEKNLQLQNKAKNLFVREGFFETIHFSFAQKSWLEMFGFNPQLKLMNPLSEELEWMVPSLIPSLLQTALNNHNHHFGSETVSQRLFELRPTYLLGQSGKVEATSQLNTGAEESWKLSFLMSGFRNQTSLKTEQAGIDFFDIKGILEALFEDLATKGIRWLSLSTSKTQSNLKNIFHPGKSVEILAGNKSLGFVGLLHPQLAKKIKLKDETYLGELNWDVISEFSRSPFLLPSYKPWPKFPGMERDFALVVDENVSADKIVQVALKAGKPLAKQANIFDVYRGAGLGEQKKSVAIKVHFFEESRSLQESETEGAAHKIIEAFKKDFGAELRGL